MLRRTATASAANGFSRNLRLSDYVMRTARQIGSDASNTWQQKQEQAREQSWKRLPNENPPLSDEIVKLIRKLRWVGLEDKAQQLEDELERHAVTDTVVSIQSETD